MGCSIYVVTRKEKLARKMYKYLQSALNNKWLSNARIAANFDPAPSLSYARIGENQYQVGFNYSLMGNTESAFVWDIIKWMAKTLGLTRYCDDGCEYIKIEGVDAQSSLNRAYKMPHVSRFIATFVRRTVGPTKKEITEAKCRLQQIQDGWSLYAKGEPVS